MNTSSATWQWNSPVPYLFGGLGLVLILIAVALVILALSHRKSPSNSSGEDQGGNLSLPGDTQVELSPGILIIMAGDEEPTYLAKPVSSSYCSVNA
ncbi:hypothetical protein NMG60_11006267 [Bertholletia excelsa]